ncbi:hypothetical protein [Streptomyces sp. NPDC090445]|uniref:hypothetical protein n=1 Tax=Streptomyces sp. NPDC090445 TaxID=3365963 RepID=UPI0038295154
MGTEAGNVGTAIDQRLRLAFTTAAPVDLATEDGIDLTGGIGRRAGLRMRAVGTGTTDIPNSYGTGWKSTRDTDPAAATFDSGLSQRDLIAVSGCSADGSEPTLDGPTVRAWCSWP